MWQVISNIVAPAVSNLTFYESYGIGYNLFEPHPISQSYNGLGGFTLNQTAPNPYQYTTNDFVFRLKTSGTLPRGGIILDIADISASNSHYTYYSYGIPPSGSTNTGSYSTGVESDAQYNVNYTYSGITLPGWGGDTVWSGWNTSESLLMNPVDTYSHRLLRINKFTPPAGDQDRWLVIRFSNNAQLGHMPPYPIMNDSYFQLYNIYWRKESDNSDTLLWSA